MSENFKPFFSDESVESSKLVDCKTVKLTDWIKWASNTSKSDYRVVLPMIQRGAVWAPHKLLDLWDTLLRGMPVGALMVSENVETVGASIKVKVLGEKDSQSKKAGDIDLIDGQQRTLAMLAGWPEGLKNPSRPVAIWVDFLDSPQGEYRFRLWATTRSQPFAYSRASVGGQPLSKLERQKLRLANQAYHPTKEKLGAQDLWNQLDFMPWDAKFALPLTKLIDNKGKLLEFVNARLTDYQKTLESKSTATSTAKIDDLVAQHFANKLKALSTTDYEQLAQRIAHFEKALDRLYSYEFPVIHVREESFTDDDQSIDENTDPALAVLFKRVGTGGEPLSNADYVYSVIKHHSNEVHDMVETLLEDEKICAIYIPTTLVMSAVRLTILSLKTEDSKGRKLTDSAKLDKVAFSRMVRTHPGFIEAFKNYIQPKGAFVTSLKQVLEHISYTNDFKTGLPKHALCLVQIPLLETLLVWHTLCTPSEDALKESSLAMLRFVLQGNLCILDYAKASEVAIKALKESIISASETFPDQALLNQLAAGNSPLAYHLPSPEVLSEPNGLTISPKGTNGLRGWTRFVANGEHQKSAELYKRWWNRTGRHVHPMLLWLQRDYIFETFENEAALAGMDEETPFDFDHILPSAQWANWTGSAGNNRLIDFPIKDVAGNVLDNSGCGHIGNSIGNIHVLESSENRSWGDASVNEKLDKSSFPKNALIDGPSVWHTASGDKEKGRHWDTERALAFQLAVEHRSFALYQKFYKDLQCGS